MPDSHYIRVNLVVRFLKNAPNFESIAWNKLILGASSSISSQARLQQRDLTSYLQQENLPARAARGSYRLQSSFQLQLCSPCSVQYEHWKVDKSYGPAPFYILFFLGNIKYGFIWALVLALPSLETTSTRILTSWINPRK